MNDVFHSFARWAANRMGSHWSFVVALSACFVWALTGPFFEYSDTWQLVINTATTVLTFIAVFLIQNTQNRDGVAIQLKLDELLRAVEGARDHRLVGVEQKGSDELDEAEEHLTSEPHPSAEKRPR